MIVFCIRSNQEVTKIYASRGLELTLFVRRNASPNGNMIKKETKAISEHIYIWCLSIKQM